MVDIRQTREYAKYLSKIGWEVERIAGINYFIKKFPLIGSVLKVQRPEEIKINKIYDLAKKYLAFQIIVEPKRELDAKFLTSVGYKLSKSPYLPTKTLFLDLGKSEKVLLAGFKKDSRAAIYSYEKVVKSEAKRVVNSGKNLESTIGPFRGAWKTSVGLKRYVPPLSHLLALKESFKDNALFITTTMKNAGAIFLKGDKVAYYWQAFTNKEGRRTLAQYKIVWEGIKWAKDRGAKVFDFEGIYDERFPNKSWLGFTHFKKSFGGYEVTYPGCFTKVILPFRLLPNPTKK